MRHAPCLLLEGLLRLGIGKRACGSTIANRQLAVSRQWLQKGDSGGRLARDSHACKSRVAVTHTGGQQAVKGEMKRPGGCASDRESGVSDLDCFCSIGNHLDCRFAHSHTHGDATCRSHLARAAAAAGTHIQHLVFQRKVGDWHVRRQCEDRGQVEVAICGGARTPPRPPPHPHAPPIRCMEGDWKEAAGSQGMAPKKGVIPPLGQPVDGDSEPCRGAFRLWAKGESRPPKKARPPAPPACPLAFHAAAAAGNTGSCTMSNRPVTGGNASLTGPASASASVGTSSRAAGTASTLLLSLLAAALADLGAPARTHEESSSCLSSTTACAGGPLPPLRFASDFAAGAPPVPALETRGILASEALVLDCLAAAELDCLAPFCSSPVLGPFVCPCQRHRRDQMPAARLA